MNHVHLPSFGHQSAFQSHPCVNIDGRSPWPYVLFNSSSMPSSLLLKLCLQLLVSSLNNNYLAFQPMGVNPSQMKILGQEARPQSCFFHPWSLFRRELFLPPGSHVGLSKQFALAPFSLFPMGPRGHHRKQG